MRPYRALSVAILAGCLAAAAGMFLMEIESRYLPEASGWKAPLESVLVSILTLSPGLVAGYLAPRSGFAAGSIAGLLASVLSSIYAAALDVGPIVEKLNKSAIPEEVTWALTAVVIGGICGIAGAAVAREKWNAF